MTGMDTMTQNVSSACNDAPDVDFPAFKEKFTKTEKLYHYTTFETATKILCSGKLRYSKLKNLNDINESYRPAYVAFDVTTFPDNKTFKDLENAIQRFGQISLSVDKEDNHPGFAISPMWAHYAKKGEGVCLVFDKAKLERQLRAKKQANDVDFGKISYMQEYAPDLISSGGNMTDCKSALFAGRQNAFFVKTEYWAYEQEYRVIRKLRGTKDAFLNVKNAFLAVILCNAPDIKPRDHISGSVQYAAIQKMAGNIPVCCYASFFGERNLSWQGYTLWSSKGFDVKNVDV